MRGNGVTLERASAGVGTEAAARGTAVRAPLRDSRSRTRQYTPSGASRMIAMIATPYTTPWMPGNIAPSSAFSPSANGTSTAAPITGPHRLPTPPNSARISACAETSMPNTLSGVTTSMTTPYSPPATAASAPDSISASIFQRQVLMPAASAAGSFCLIAVSAMPNRVFSTHSEISSAITSSASASTTYTRRSANCMYKAGASRSIGSASS